MKVVNSPELLIKKVFRTLNPGIDTCVKQPAEHQRGKCVCPSIFRLGTQTRSPDSPGPAARLLTGPHFTVTNEVVENIFLYN